jgi:hypothetical protein
MKTQTATEQAFLRAAKKELGALLAEVSGADVRHGRSPRTLDQDQALLEARRGALRSELDDIADELDELAEQEPEAAPAERTIEDEAAFMRAAKRELDALIAEEWGPPINGKR